MASSSFPSMTGGLSNLGSVIGLAFSGGTTTEPFAFDVAVGADDFPPLLEFDDAAGEGEGIGKLPGLGPFGVATGDAAGDAEALAGGAMLFLTSAGGLVDCAFAAGENITAAASNKVFFMNSSD
jgi:hypothetical protein